MDPRLPKGLACLVVVLLVTLTASPGALGQQDDSYLTCFYYTWTGKNISVDCEDCKVDILNEVQPCLDTLVYTDPYQQPPNVSDIINHCLTVEKCPPYTCREKKKCVKLSWYDISNTLVNYSSFCGNVVDDNKVEQVNVELEMQVDTFTKKVRVCDTNLCNAAGVLGSPRGVALMGVGLVPLLVSIWHSRVFSS